MIVDYDKNPSLTVDQKLQSLIESIHRALDEIRDDLDKLSKEVAEIKEGD